MVGNARPVASPRATRTRSEILAAATELFAQKGFHGTRLEDVGERVGIRKPSVLHHFADKRALYDGVLAEVASNLAHHLQTTASRDREQADAEAAIDAWIAFLAERPDVARLALRETADARPGRPSPFLQQVLPILALADQVARPGQKKRTAEGIDPLHLAITVTGATVFFLLAMPLLGKAMPRAGEQHAQLDQLRREVRGLAHRLLGAANDAAGPDALVHAGTKPPRSVTATRKVAESNAATRRRPPLR